MIASKLGYNATAGQVSKSNRNIEYAAFFSPNQGRNTDICCMVSWKTVNRKIIQNMNRDLL